MGWSHITFIEVTQVELIFKTFQIQWCDFSSYGYIQLPNQYHLAPRILKTLEEFICNKLDKKLPRYTGYPKKT